MIKSTRSNTRVLSSQAIINGLSSDGGLYIFEQFPKLKLTELLNLNYQQLSCVILESLLDDYTKEEVSEAVYKAYDEKFTNKNIVNFKHFDNYSILELFHGPTLAFKDMALTILPELLRIAKKKNNIIGDTIILTATSGDTGGATLSGFQKIDGMKVIVFYPNNGVSEIQEKQMLSFRSKTSEVIAIEGNFDDTQNFVKKTFQKYSKLSSSNSINIGRLAPQVIYYVYSYLEMVKSGQIQMGEYINVCVPTGNFGNILAAYLSKKMGLPINKFICASNENKVLTDFFKNGIYDKNRQFYKTNSPSMDILISSNLERLLYLLSSDKETKELMEQLNSIGKYELSTNIKEKLSDFYGGSCDSETTINIIKTMFEKNNYLIDPHTAVAYKVYCDYQEDTKDTTKTLIVSTASPYKFPETVTKSLDIKIEGAMDQIEAISEKAKIEIPSVISTYKNLSKTVWSFDEKEKKLEQLMEKMGYDYN